MNPVNPVYSLRTPDWAQPPSCQVSTTPAGGGIKKSVRNPLTSKTSLLIPPAYAGGTDCAFDFHFSFE